jgi:heptosyltransferase-2
MAQSLFKILKAQDNSAVIDVLAPNWSRPLLARMPEVHKAHPMPIGHGALQLAERYRIAVALRSERYTKAILLVNSWKSALIPWWAKIPKRTGFLGECRVGLLNDIRILDKKRLPRLIDRFASLAYEKNAQPLEAVPYPSFRVDPASVKKTVEKFAVTDDLKRPILALCPGAEFGSSKRWPESYYAKVALIKRKEGWAVWLFGSANDKAVAARIQEETGGQCLDFTGKTGLDEAIDLLSLATTVVTNDSGLMHIAAALARPLIAVYGSTDPGYTPPLGEAAQVVRLSLPCSPCFARECPLIHHKCMQDLHPEKVLAAMDTVVA